MSAIEGNALDAARLWGAGITVKNTGQIPDDDLIWESVLVEARDALGPAVFDAAIDEGKSLGFEDAVLLARSDAVR